MVSQAVALKQDCDEMFADFYFLVQRCCDCGDYDPFHLLLRNVEADMDREEALWFSCLFIAYYNPGSAWIAFHDSKVLRPKQWNLPIETARRALFGGRIHRHLEDLSVKARKMGGLYKFFTQGFRHDRRENWRTLRQTIGSVYGAGRWAEYTFGEILQKVHHFPVIPTDMGNRGSSGPRNGLILLTGKSTDVAAANLYRKVRTKISVPWFDYAVLESVSCDFNSLNKGRYYIGRDIDRQQYRIRRAEEWSNSLLLPLWKARKECFPSQYLGELNGWEGIDKPRLRHYIQTGKVLDR